MDLDPYAFRLYVHIKRVTGETGGGKCWQNTDTLAKACKMSAGMVSQAKATLADKGLITIREESNQNGKYHIITINDIWAENMARYTGDSQDEGGSSPHERRRSPHETKKNPLEEEPKESTRKPSRAAPAPAPEKPPAVVAYREIAHLWPHKSLWQRIDQDIGRDPPAIDRWKETVLAWLGMGWNPRNVKGMLEHYARNEIPGAKGRPGQPSPYPGGQAPEDFVIKPQQPMELIPIPPEEVEENERRKREEYERLGIPVAPPRNDSHLDSDGRPRRAYPVRRYLGT